MGVGSEAWAVVGWKSTDETVQEREGSVGDSAGLVGEGVEFVGRGGVGWLVDNPFFFFFLHYCKNRDRI